MPVVMKWNSPGALIRAGGSGFGNGDFVNQTISGKTTVVIDLIVTQPSGGVSTSQPPVVTITRLPADGTSGSPTDILVQGSQLTFSIGNNAAEAPGQLHRLNISLSGDESFTFRIHRLLAIPCTFEVYYVLAPNPTTTTTTTRGGMPVRKGVGSVGTTTTTTPAPVSPPVRKKAKV